MKRLLIPLYLILTSSAYASIAPINCISGVSAGTGETVTQAGSVATVTLSPTDTQAETYTSSITVNSNLGVTGQINAPLTVTSSATYTTNVEVDGFTQIASKTVAQFLVLTPTAVGQIYYCSNCAALRMCVSTGTVVGSFASPVAATTACN